MNKKEKSEIVEEKIDLLAYKIVNYSLNVKENERVLINTSLDDELFIKKLVKYIVENDGIPFVRISNPNITSFLTQITKDNRIKEIGIRNTDDINNYDSFINIRYIVNDYLNKNIDPEIIRKIAVETKESDYIRINNRKWILLNYPSVLDAYKAKMNTYEYKKYAIDVMNVDYEKMDKDIEPLKELMEKTDAVRIIGPNTDIEFSIKNMPIIPCVGNANLPDGELYTAPIKDSVNGIITYNTLSPYQGNIYENISLIFKDGKIIETNCKNDHESLEKIFDTDEGARYIGEFSLGLNPLILDPMGDILYDEKIIGSLHFTPGQSYENAYNDNDSGIHWDLVLIQRKEYGGGEIYFDNVLVRKDGLFVLPELMHLNYDLK